MQEDAPAAPAVREMLERVLGSETFSRSERSRKLLRYLVERELAGERLKGFNVAMDVFGKDTDFDPSTDAVVRVQAGRLRDLLTQYYEGEGALDPVKIYIPRGGYVPSYRSECPNVLEEKAEAARAAAALRDGADPAPPAPAVAVQPAPAHGAVARILSALKPSSRRLDRHIQMMWATLIVLLTVVAIMALRMGFGGMPQGVASTMPDVPITGSIEDDALPLDALPTVRVTSDAGGEAVARALRQGLAGFEMVNLVLGGEPTTPLDFGFAVSGNGENHGVSVVLSDGSGRVLDLRAISIAGDVPVDDQVAALLTSTVTPAGAVFASIDRGGSASGLVHCLLVNDEYYLDQGEQRHRDAYTCMERLVEQGVRSPLVFSELASLELKAVTDGYAYPPGASQDHAFVLARRAVKAGMNSPYAHRALGFLFGRTGNQAESVRWMRKAYELNTYDMSMAAAYGYSLVFAGDYRLGEPIMTRAVEAASAHPSWWDFGLFIARFMLDDTSGATRATEPLIGGKRQHYVAALAVMAQASGDEPRAATLLADLTLTYPDFAADPAGTLTLAHYPADFVARFTAALRAAGLGSSG